MAFSRTLQHFTSSQELATIWASGQSYILNQLVLENDIIYRCAIAHTSGLSFATDLGAGKWVAVSAAGASGSKNYIENSDFEDNNTTGWSLFNTTIDSTTKIPTGSIVAGAAGFNALSVSGSSPLAGSYSLSVSTAAGVTITTTGYGFISDAFTIDREDQAKVMGFSFYYEAVSGTMNFSGTSSNTFAVYIRDVNGGAWIQPAGVYNLVQSSGSGICSGTFQTTATGTQYQIAVLMINTVSATVSMRFDDFQLGPQKVLQGPSGPVGEIIATGSVTPPAGFLYCNGQSVSVSQYQDLFNSIGYTYGGSGANFNVPDLRGVFLRGAGSQTIGAETYTATLGAKQNDATAKNGLFDSGHVHTQQAPNFATGGAINVRQFVSGTGSVPTSENITTASGAANLSSTDTETRPANVAVAYHIRYLATYQMSQDTDTRVVAARATSAITGVVAGDATVIYPTSVNDTHGSYSAATGIYTVPVSGFYRATASIFFDVYSWTSGDLVDLRINCAGTLVSRNYYRMPTLVSKQISADTCSTFYATAGQQITVSASQTVGGTRNLDGNSSLNYFTVERLSGPATIAASETVGCTYDTLSANTVTGAGIDLIYTNKVFDTHGAYNTSTGEYTVPVSGEYTISGQYRAGTTAMTIGFGTTIFVRIDGTLTKYLGLVRTQTASGIIREVLGGPITLRLNAGQKVKFGASSDTNTALDVPQTQFNWMSIMRTGN